MPQFSVFFTKIFSSQAVKSWFKKSWPYLVLISLWLIIVLDNLLPAQTWLMGYDNMLPELNLKLAWQRSFFSIWQDYRGLGVVNSVMDASELTRLPWVFLIKLLFGARQVRFIWMVVMILMGTIGAYILALQLLTLIFQEKKKLSRLYLQSASFIVALFYLCNPAMIQFFYTPLETFANFYGFLPLIFWAFIAYVRDSTRRKLLILFIIAFLSSSAFYVQTFFVVLMMVLVVFSFSFLLRLNNLSLSQKKFLFWQHNWLLYAKRIFIAFLTIMMANAFWFLPLVFTTWQNSNDVFTSKQNLISTPQVQEMNKTYGNLKQVVLLYGYWFEFQEYNHYNDQYYPYLDQWSSFWEKKEIKFTGYILFCGSVIGYSLSFFLLKKREFWWGLVGVTLLSFLMMTAGEGFFLGIFFRLFSRLSLFQQMFRVTFTKWSVVLSLTYGFGLGLLVLSSLFLSQKIIKKYQSLLLVLLVVVSSLIISRVSLVFQGQLFGWQVKVILPKEYHALAQFMTTLDETATVAYLPMPNFWGWLFYNWGYRGSGFLWQMIPQATLDRNFDVWSLANQNAYQQLNLALERNDVDLLANVIRKYQLRYFIFDENIIYANLNNQLIKARASNEIKELLAHLHAKMIWRQGSLYVYDLSMLADQTLLTISHDYQKIVGDKFLGLKDSVFQAHHHYLATDFFQEQAVYYPFAQEYQEEISQISCSINQCALQEQQKIKPLINQTSQLILPKWQDGEKYIANGTINFIGERILEIIFEPQLQLLIDDSLYNLPQLHHLLLEEVESSQGKVVIDFGDQKPYLVEKNKFTDFAVELEVGSNLHLKLIDASDLNTQFLDQALIVSQDKVKHYYFKGNIWDNIKNPATINLANDAKISALWSATSFRLNIQEKTDIINCDVGERGQVEKTVYPNDITYRSENSATLCEHYSLADLSSLNDYLVHFKVEHQQGHPMQFYMTDALTKRLIIDQVLNPLLQEQYFYLPRLKITDNQQHNLVFHLLNKSYGKTSQNAVKQIRLLQYPIDYLSQIKVVSQVTPVETTSLYTYNTYRLSDWQRKNFAFYSAKVNLLTQEARENSPIEPILILHRAYHPSWRADVILANGQKLKLKHQLYNGWANAWLMPPNQDIKQIKVYFWPQNLFYIGLSLSLSSLLLIILVQYLSPKKKRQWRLTQVLK